MARAQEMTGVLPRLLRVLRYFWPWVRRERTLVVGSTTALLASTVVRLAEPWPLKFVLDRILPAGQAAEGAIGNDLHLWLALAAVSVVAISAMRAWLDYQQRIGFAKIGNRVLQRVRPQVFDHLQRLSPLFHTRKRSGDLVIRVTRDVTMLRDVAATAMLPLVASTLVVFGMAIVLFALQWRLALLACLTVPLLLLSTRRTGRGIHEAAAKQRKREGAMAATAVESISAIREVQALSLEKEFSQSFASRNVESQKEDLKAARLSARLGRTVDLLAATATALVLWYGVRLVLREAMTIGEVVVFLNYLKRSFKPAKDFAKYTARLAKATAAGERVIAVMEETPAVQDRPDARPAPALRGGVTLERVTFAYAPDRPVLQDVDLRIAPGRFVALVGPSGSGKSTLIGLILRLWEPSAGRLLVDDVDVRDYRVGSVRSQIAVVTQDTLVFAGTVAENVACGADGITDSMIVEACRQAGADEFIRRLPHGYETLVGERGADLSRGQRQRLAIARALLRQAPILILDEPTTGLDPVAADRVRDAIQALPRGTTTLLVTHDRSLAELADECHELDRGVVRPFDRHNTAAALKGGLHV